jgi:hypothetical protein
VFCLEQRFPTLGHDPNEGRRGSDVGSQEGFMEISIIRGGKNQNFYLNCMSYLNKDLFLACFVYLMLSQKMLDLTSNIKNLIFFFNKWQHYVVFKKRH